MVALTGKLDRKKPAYTFSRIVDATDRTCWRPISVADYQATGLLAFQDGGCSAILSHNPRTRVLALQTRLAWPDCESQSAMAAMLKMQCRHQLVRLLPDFGAGGIMLQAVSLCPSSAIEVVVPLIVRQLVAGLADDHLRAVSRQSRKIS